jgi:hypothetical protein
VDVKHNGTAVCSWSCKGGGWSFFCTVAAALGVLKFGKKSRSCYIKSRTGISWQSDSRMVGVIGLEEGC